MRPDFEPQQIVSRYTAQRATAQNRNRLSKAIAGNASEAEKKVDQLRLIVLSKRLEVSARGALDEVEALQPQVNEFQVAASNYLKEDRDWQRNIGRLAKLDAEGAEDWELEYQKFKAEALANPSIQAGLQILAEKKEEDGQVSAASTLATPAPVVTNPVAPSIITTTSSNADTNAGANAEEVELDLTKIALGPKALEIAQAIPQDPYLVIPRTELHHVFYPQRPTAASSIDNNLTVIQARLPQEFTIVNYSPNPKMPSLYGIRRRRDYEGLLSQGNQTIPRLLQAEQVAEDQSNPGQRMLDEVIRPSEEDQKRAQELMNSIKQLIEDGGELDPAVLKHVEKEYAKVIGIATPSMPVIPFNPSDSYFGKPKASGIEDFLPPAPAIVGGTSGVGESVPVREFEQREENKRTEDENYILKFVFDLQAEARDNGNQYIDNNDFQNRLKPRRTFEEEGTTKLETYATSDIVRLFVAGFEKLLNESRQDLVRGAWDEETQKVYDSVLEFAQNRRIAVDRVKYIVRNQLRAIGRNLDMDSRRVEELRRDGS